MSARAIPGRGLLGVLLAASLAACVTTQHSFPQPGATPRPGGSAGAAMAANVIAALAAQGLQASESNRPYRPVEGPLLAAAPRNVVQVALPEDPAHGFVVVYALASPAQAREAAEDHAAYLAAGIGGGVQNPPGTEYVLRLVGSSVVYFNWLPANSPDPRTPQIAQALRTIGTEVPIPD